MTPANYNTASNYDENATVILSREVNERGNAINQKDEKCKEIILEHIITDREYKLKVYRRLDKDADEYIKRYVKTEEYSASLKDYQELRLEDILDVSRFFPVKNLVIEQMPAYLLGYTAIGASNIFRNAMLISGSEKAYEVDVHETIHTDDEFETRILTSWILDKDVNKYLFEKGIIFRTKKDY